MHDTRLTGALNRNGAAWTMMLGLTLLAAAGCQSSPRAVRIATTQPASSLQGTPFDPTVEAPYTLYAGDRLIIRYPTDPDLDQEVRIRSDGFISLPYVGDVPAAGLSPAELANAINQRYAEVEVLKRPQVAVIVTEEAGRRIYLGGQVRAPGAMPLHPNLTLSQAIFEAGGLTPQAQEEVVVIRNQPGDATYVLKANLKRILAGEEPDVRLAPFDVVHVPETIIARLDLFVEQYINGLIPRAAIFTFTTELKNQPVKVVNNQPTIPPVSITR